jgi:hypothetical protein
MVYKCLGCAILTSGGNEMTNIKKQVTWTGKSGQMVLDITSIRGAGKYTETYNADWEKFSVEKSNVIVKDDVTLTVGGRVINGLRPSDKLAKDNGLAMMLTDGITKVGVADQEVADQIVKAIADAKSEAEQDEEYQAEWKKTRGAIAEDRAYEAAHNRVVSAMSY